MPAKQEKEIANFSPSNLSTQSDPCLVRPADQSSAPPEDSRDQMKNRVIHGVTSIVSAPQEDQPPPSRQPKPLQRVDAALQTQEPLEEEEQDALIRDFEQAQLQAARTWRANFGSGAAILAFFFCWQAWQQFFHPWGSRITGELRGGGADSDSMVVALLFQGLAMAACSSCLLEGMPARGAPERGCLPAGLRQRVLLGGSLAVSLVCCAFWLSVHHGMITKFGTKLGGKWDLLWVPFAPVLFNLVCSWVVSSLNATGRDVAGMRQLKYAWKTA